jgi:hypothetical protein
MLNVRDADWPVEEVTVICTEAVVVAALAVAAKGAMEGTVVVACCPCTVPEMIAVFVSALTVSFRPRGK